MIPIFEPFLGGQEREYLLEAIDTGWISSQGRFIGEFEEGFATYNGVPFGVATSNCTTALHLAMVAMGIGPGDEVLCSDLTFIAPVNMIALAGATPVLVDVDPLSWGMRADHMEALITDKTKAVIVVHPFGHAADMDAIMPVAKSHGLLVIEDVAEAPGGRYKEQMLGTFGEASCFSFFANKIMTTGEGGMVLCRDEALEKSLRIYRDHGMSREKRYYHIVAGYNYRMTNMQAAVGLGQLERFDEILARRSRQDRLYRKLLSDNAKIQARPIADWCGYVHWMTTISLPEAPLREALLAHMKENGIDGRQMVFPVHEALPYREQFDPANYPVSRDISFRSLHLPSSTELSEDDVQVVCDCVLEWAARNL